MPYHLRLRPSRLHSPRHPRSRAPRIMVRSKASQPGSRPPSPGDPAPQEGPSLVTDPGLAVARGVIAAAGVQSDTGSTASSDVSSLQLMEARMTERFEAQMGNQLARMQEYLEGRMQAQMQALAALLKTQPVGPSEAAVPASADPPPSLPSIHPGLGEGPELSSCLLPGMPAEPRLPQRSRAPPTVPAEPRHPPPGMPAEPCVPLSSASNLAPVSQPDSDPQHGTRPLQSTERLPPQTQPPVSFPSVAGHVPRPPALHPEASHETRPSVSQPSVFAAQGPLPVFAAPVTQPTACQPPTFPSSFNPQAPATHMDGSWTRPYFGSGRDEVPVFCGETPASQGIQQSQELESWISCIELATLPATSEAYIRMARSRVRGYAWSVLNSPAFAHIQDWVEFKARLREQFRGVTTAKHFFDMLARARMSVGQGPLDFYRAVALAVQQGARDYPLDIGNAESLMQRTFREGLPGWLRQQLLWHDFPSTRVMAEKCQLVWDSVVGARQSLPDVHGLFRHSSRLWSPHYGMREDRMTLGAFKPGQHLNVSAPGLEFYSDVLPQAAPVARASEAGSSDYPQQVRRPAEALTSPHHSTSPRQVPSPRRRRPWCDFHRMGGHNTSECRAGRGRCYRCGEPGHLKAVCPFSQGRSEADSRAAGGRSFQPGSQQPAYATEVPRTPPYSPRG